MGPRHFIIILILIGFPGTVHGREPLDVLRGAIDRGLSILMDPTYREAGQRDLQEQKLWEIALQVFDFEVFSSRVLGTHRGDFTPDQRKEFTEVFARFLRKTYIPMAQERYTDEEVLYVGQALEGESRATVKIKVVWKRAQIPLQVRMIKREGTWRAYDAVFLGISVAGNYRAQLSALLNKETPAQVIQRLKAKIAQLERKRRTKRRERQGP